MGDPELRQDRKVAAVRASLLCALVNLILALVDAGRYEDVRARCDELRALPGAVAQPRILTVLGLAALTEGAVGYVDSSTPVLGKRSIEFYNAATSGDLETARRLQTNMAKLNAGFFGVGTFPAGVKVALDMLGRPGGWPRDPVKPLNAEQQNIIREVLISTGLIAENA